MGNDLDNVLLGNSEAPDGPFGIPRGNTLYGRAGNDILDGGAGLDQMYGGTGNDVYYVNAVATTPRGDIIFDRIYENKNEGTDTLYARLSYAMPHNVEVGILQESARPLISPLFLIGNGADTLIGNSDGNIFYAAGTGFSYGYGAVVDGNVDIMIGGKGDDIYHVSSGSIVIELAGGGTDTVYATFSGYTLGANLENLSVNPGYTGSYRLTGNDLDNVITGAKGNDDLDGGKGADRMIGGAGDDIYHVGNPGDVVVEVLNGGTDTVRSTISYTLGYNLENLVLEGLGNIDATGNYLDKSIFGNDGNNLLMGAGGSDYIDGGKGRDVLHGGAGMNTLIGGLGDDDYHVSSLTDRLIERAGEGYDRVTASVDHVLQSNFEELTLFGTANLKGVGNAGDNRLTGNSGDNALYGGGGDDILTGGAGSNLLGGGSGNDTYYVTSLTDKLYEAAGEGFDRVFSTVDHALESNFEYLKLSGTASIKGVGNAQANHIIGNDGDNMLFGGAGNDILEGGAGANLLVGGAGNDDYHVISAADRLVELPGEGYDRVFSTVDHALQGGFEDLTLTGAGNINGWGNNLDNVIQGNGGDNRLYGGDGADRIRDGLGSDVVYGGTGADLYLMGGVGDGTDRFVFNSIEEADRDRFGDAATGEGYFRTGQSDIIDLSAIDASSMAAGNDAFTFKGYADFTKTAGELILKANVGSANPSYFIMGDINGDGVENFAITIAGSGSLVAADFIL